MDKERFLVTGALGCIGAWVLRNLVREGTPVTALDLGRNRGRLALVLSEAEIARVQFVNADITDLAAVERTILDAGITHIVHLAALQLPFCQADPPLGARVNVVGTVNLFEAARRAGLHHLAYASTTAVYGLDTEYPRDPLPHDAPLLPRSHYGVYKQANEGTARVYWLESGISSIGLRPYVVYGPGRDQGMTSTTTKAILAAAARLPYQVSYGGRYCLQFADDTARVFIRAARQPFQGAEAFNLGGPSVSTAQVIAAIEACEPEMRGKITYKDIPLPFPQEVDHSALVRLLGDLPETPLEQGVSATLEIFHGALRSGCVSLDQLNA
jgi:UDP-glucuronate 4-epimerase